MGDLLSELVKADLIDPHEAAAIRDERVDRAREQERRAARKLERSVCSAQDLESVPSMGEFDHYACQLLIERPELVTEVARRAHRFRDSGPGSAFFIRKWLEIRGTLPALPRSRQEGFLRRALRRAGVTFGPVAE